jgi:hypothetical protein
MEKEADIAPHILWFVAGRRSVFSLTFWPLYLRENNFCYSLSMRLCRDQRESERFEAQII